MRIITPGKLPEEKVGRGTCYHCKAQVEAKQSECKTLVAPYQAETDYYVPCPTEGCKKNIWLTFKT